MCRRQRLAAASTGAGGYGTEIWILVQASAVRSRLVTIVDC